MKNNIFSKLFKKKETEIMLDICPHCGLIDEKSVVKEHTKRCLYNEKNKSCYTCSFYDVETSSCSKSKQKLLYPTTHCGGHDGK